MLTAILADDEPMILKGLEKLINWRSLGVEIIGTASDGLEALDLIKSLQPDMVVSDINMPKLTGIALIKEINHLYPATKVVFISGYQEFEYARDALRYGAVDYLLKPINEKQLVSVIEKITEDSQDQPPSQKLELYLSTDPHLVNVEDDIAKTQRHFVDKKGFYGVLCCALDDSQNLNPDDKEITLFSTLNIIEHVVEDMKDHWIISKNDYIYLLLYNEHQEEVESLMSTTPRLIIDTLQDASGQSVSISQSRIVDDINNIRSAFAIATDNIQQTYFYDYGSVLGHQDNHVNKYTLEDHYKAQVAILNSITTYDSNKIQRSVTYYMDIVKDISLWDKKLAINYCLATLVFIQQHLSDDTTHLKKKDFTQLRTIFESTSSYSELSSLMNRTCESYLEAIITYAKTQQNTDINKVKAYIQEHYQEPIKLETLADIVFMNPNYFSGYFKKHVGVKFKDYITNFRINEAEKLMLTTNYKVYEIAEAVGFGDYRHFSEVFKKIKGHSPSEYKKIIMKQID